MLNRISAQHLSIILTTVVVLMSFYGTEACALTGTETITPVKNYITDNLMKNAGVIGALAAFVVGIVAALGQKISQFILNNMSYLAYVAFGGGIILGTLTAVGVTI